MPREFAVEICLNEQAAVTAKTKWTGLDYEQKRIITKGDLYIANERKGAAGEVVQEIGNDAADATEALTILIFEKMT